MNKKLNFDFWTEKTYGIKCQDGEWYNRSNDCKLTKEGVKNILSNLKKGDLITLELDSTGKYYNSIYVGEKVDYEVAVKEVPVENKPLQSNLLDSRQSLIVKQNVLNRAVEIAMKGAEPNEDINNRVLPAIKEIAKGLYEFVTGEKW